MQVVEYGDIQFTKDAAVLEGMGLAGLGKSEAAVARDAEKGLLLGVGVGRVVQQRLELRESSWSDLTEGCTYPYRRRF